MIKLAFLKDKTILKRRMKRQNRAIELKVRNKDYQGKMCFTFFENLRFSNEHLFEEIGGGTEKRSRGESEER